MDQSRVFVCVYLCPERFGLISHITYMCKCVWFKKAIAKMMKSIRWMAFAGIILLASCNENAGDYKQFTNDPLLYCKTVKKLNDVVLENNFPPMIATRNYAKRQYTWFRHQPPSEWPRIETDDYRPGALFEILFRHLGLT